MKGSVEMKMVELTLPGMEDYFTQEAYKVLRTNLQFCGQDIRVIAVTSYNENEGKSTVALHIGKSFAELGKNVLVIDADMRKSVMAGRNTSVRGVKGLSEVLTGMSRLDECVYRCQVDRLHILFAGQYPPNPVELLDGKQFSALMNGVRGTFDYVIVDTPPLGQVIDAAVITANCDGAIMVLGNGKVRQRQAKEVVDQIRKSGCKVLGVVKNGTKKTNKAYYRTK